MSNPESSNDEMVHQFINVTKSTKYLAEQYLNRNNGDLLAAIEDFYATNSSTPSNQDANKKLKNKGPGIKTFRDLNGDDDDELDDKTNTNFFTGGEKSALQVEDPNKKDKNREQSLIDQIFKKAQEQMSQPDDRPSANQPEFEAPKFTGTGFKLGDGTEPSETFIDPNAHRHRPTKVTRELTFWKQGFTVGDGPLHRYDDPANEQVLQELNRGRVPVSLLNVEFGQDVDVSVIKKNDQDYQPKKKIGGYHGHGQRLGSPVPGESFEKPVVSEPEVSKPQEVDNSNESSNGDSLVQIRFANGKKTSHKFNSTDPISTVYEFVRVHEFNEQGRPFNLSHAFPVKPIEDSDDVTVADAKLKNAVIVQRWK